MHASRARFGFPHRLWMYGLGSAWNVPGMKIESIGYGAGTKELKEQANVLRLIVGEAGDDYQADQIWVLETNLARQEAPAD